MRLIDAPPLGYRPAVMNERLRRVVSILLAGAAGAVVVWLLLPRRDPPPTAPAAVAAAAPRSGAGATDGAEPLVARELPAPPPAVAPPPPPEEDDAIDESATGDDMDAIAAAWAQVDMDAVRAALPGNLYFELSMPTQDEAVLAERQAERARWNVEYGKILSGTATEEEITAYYDLRAKLSSDYIEFTTHLLDRYGDTLTARDVGLLGLARRLHAARLEEIPRKVEEALERKRQQDEARAAWLAGQAEFDAADPPPSE